MEDIPLPMGRVVRLQSQGVSEREQRKAVAHAAVFRPLKHKVRVVLHQLATQERLEGIVVLWLTEKSLAGIPPVDGVVNTTRLA
jgi:hypothetical protein